MGSRMLAERKVPHPSRLPPVDPVLAILIHRRPKICCTILVFPLCKEIGRQYPKWPTSGPGRYINLAACGARHCFRAGDKMGSGPQMGHVAAYTLPLGGNKNGNGPQMGWVAI